MLNYILTNLKVKITDDKGQTMVEYGLLIALLAIAVIVILVVMGPRLANVFDTVNNELAGF